MIAGLGTKFNATENSAWFGETQIERQVGTN